MLVAWGVVVILLSLVAWLGQLINAVSPVVAVKWGLTEAEADVDPAFWADGRGECVWDALTLWTLPVAGVLLVLGKPSWAMFGLIGGSMYLYFGGRGVAQRIAMQGRGIAVGKPTSTRVAYASLVVWGLLGLVTICLSFQEVVGTT